MTPENRGIPDMSNPDSTEDKGLTDSREGQSGSIGDLQDDVVQLLQQADEERVLRVFIEKIFNTVYEPILILDAEFNVVLANASFYDEFDCSEKDILNKSFFTLGDSNWNTFGLKTLLEGILPYKSVVQNYKLQLESSQKGPRTFFINARNISKSEGKRRFIFLSFDDATDRLRAEEQKTNLMREMNHRVKNNLAVIQALLKIQAREVEDKTSKAYFNDTQARVQSISLIHEMLYHSDDLSSIDFREYISKLVEAISNYYAEPRIETELNIPEVNLDLNNMLPLGLIVNELVTNAYKHAFPDNRKGKLLIQLSRQESDNYILTVRDNGVGIPQDSDLSKSNSFGMSIVTTLIQQIGGDLEIVSDGGTTFAIKFKDAKQADSKV